MLREQVLAQLYSRASEHNRAGQARFGIKPRHNLGLSVRDLRELAGQIRIDHGLATELWESGIHEARILCSMIADPALITADLVDRWTAEFDSWDIVDQFCQNLYWRLPFAEQKVDEYCQRPEEYVKRTGFSLIASIATRNRNLSAGRLCRFLDLAVGYGHDDRNYVTKAVSWALRVVAIRHPAALGEVLEACATLAASGSKGGRWVAGDVRRELVRRGLIKPS